MTNEMAHIMKLTEQEILNRIIEDAIKRKDVELLKLIKLQLEETA
jgi:hypothetical protein